MVKSFAELLRVERARKKKSLKKVSEETGNSISYFSLIETGKKTCRDPAVFAAICKSLDIEIDQVIEAVGQELRAEIEKELNKIK